MIKHLLLRADRVTTATATWVACGMLVIAASLGVFQIVTRFILERPAEWTEVLIRFSLIWMVFMGIAAAFRQGAMVSVDVLHRISPRHWQRVLESIAALASLVLMGIVIWWGWDYALRGRVQSVIGLEGVSMFWAYLALPVGGVFCIISIVANWLDPRREELETAQ